MNQQQKELEDEQDKLFTLKGPDIQINGNMLKGGKGYQTVLSTEPLNYGISLFEVTALYGQGVRVGISPAKYDNLNLLEYPVGMWKCTYSYRFKDGNIFNDGVGVEYGLEVNTNDILRVIYDSENRKLQYILNDQQFGVAFENVIPQQYHAAIALYNEAQVKVDLIFSEPGSSDQSEQIV